MTEPTVSLREVTGSNMWPICKLSGTLQPPQNKAVAPNAVSISQAHFSDSAWFRGIYAGDTPVGFMMVDAKPESSEYYLWRLMIGSEHQGKGYGRRAIELLAANIERSPGGTKLKTSCVECDGSPEGFYTSLGF